MELRYALLPLVVLSVITGTCHVMFHSKHGKPVNICILRRLYNTLVVSAILATSIWSLHGKFINMMHIQIPVLFTLNIFSHLSLTIGVTMQSILPVFTKNEYANALTTIMEADEKLNINHRTHYRMVRMIILATLTVFHLCVSIVIIFDATLWYRSFGFALSRYYLIEPIMTYLLTMQAVQFFVILILLRERFKYVNKLLPIGARGECYELSTCTPTGFADIKATDTCHLADKTKKMVLQAPSVRELSRIHDTLYQSAVSLNNFFGFLIVIVCFEALVLVVQSVYIGVVFANGVQKALNAGFDPNLTIVLAFSWALYCFVSTSVNNFIYV